QAQNEEAEDRCPEAEKSDDSSCQNTDRQSQIESLEYQIQQYHEERSAHFRKRTSQNQHHQEDEQKRVAPQGTDAIRSVSQDDQSDM
ncbi:hypothetical protein, partial [Escherichia coli]|uniref:hypothetical protein n=1 Tax=Escherichia coli TaxID=562 RepID=UPI001D156216